MPTNRTDPPPTVPQALGHLRVALNASFNATSRQLGMTPQQAELLCAAMAPAPVGELAAALQVERSSVSHLIGRAADRGWVARRGSQEDGRVALVELTAAGERLARDFIGALEAQLDEFLRGWSQRRQSEVSRTLIELAQALQESAQRRA